MSTITVANSAALVSALKVASSGDTIQLKAGTYSDLVLKNLSFAGNVTITSADPGQKALLTNFQVNNSQGLTFRGLEVQVGGTGTYGVNIYDSQNITFDKMFVHGKLDGSAATDTGGISFLNSNNISVTNSEFTELRQAVGVGANANNVVVADNYAHLLMKTGFVFAGASNVKVTGNVISDIRPVAGQHPDAIQFFTTGTTVAAHDILISNNLITRGDGAATQGIFLRDQTGTLPYENVTISNNMVVGTGFGGIYVDGAKGLKVTGNELVSNGGDENRTFMMIQRSDSVVSTDNKGIMIGYDAVTRLTEARNVVTASVTDGGSAALNRWLIAHPEDKPFVDVLAVAKSGVVATTALASVVAKEGGEVLGDAGHNTLTGNYLANKLTGLAGNDTLDGQGGSDTLSGGAGDDVYIVPNSAAVVVEKAGEGNDTVIARGSHVLAENVENLVIDGTSSWNGTGNGLNNKLTGNAGDNSLSGGGGNDTLSGGAGKDVLVGGLGNDRLVGGTGADTFVFTPGGGKDIIADFGLGGERDLLDISAYMKAGIKSTLVDIGADVRVDFANGDSITLLGIEPSAMKSWFAGWMF